MRTGTALSVILHGAFVALALMSWRAEPLEPPEEFNTVDVEMVTIADETNVMAAQEPSPAPPAEATPPPPPPPAASEPEEIAPPPPKPPEPPRERQAALPPRAEPRAQTRTKPEPKPEPKKPEPKPEPKREEARKPEPKKPEPPKPEPKKPEPVREAKKPEPKKPEPKKPESKQPEPKQPEKPTQTAAADTKKPEKKQEKPKKKKDEFNLDDIGAAADRLADAKPEKPSDAPAKPQASGPRSAAGRGTKMTSTEIDALRSTISQCWNIPAGAPNPETLVVRLKLFLNQDGTVARQPELVDTAGRSSSDPYFRAAAEAAIRAVQVCAPYQLPPDKYDDWSEVTINFRPPL